MRLPWIVYFLLLEYVAPEQQPIEEMLHYPTDIFTYDQIKNGGSVLYFIGIFYMFCGIMQLHLIYLGPCLQCLSKIKIVEEDTMISTVRPIAMSAPEYFMCIFSTVFGVTDVGISAFLGTNAFTACIERGGMFLIAGSLGEIDWFTGYRELITYSVVLLVISMCLITNDIVLWNTILLIVIYFFYWLFMQFNQVIEKKFKSAVGEKKEEDPRLLDEEIRDLHRLKRRNVLNTPEAIMKEEYQMENGYVMCEYNDIKLKTTPRQVEFIRPKLLKFYNVTNKILCGIANKKLRYQAKRISYDPTAPANEKSEMDFICEEVVPKFTAKSTTTKIFPTDNNHGRANIEDLNDAKAMERQQQIELNKIMNVEESDAEYYSETLNMQWKSLVWPSKDPW